MEKKYKIQFGFTLIMAFTFTIFRVIIYFNNPELRETLLISKSNIILRFFFIMLSVWILTHFSLKRISELLTANLFVKKFISNIAIALALGTIYILSLYLSSLQIDLKIEAFTIMVNGLIVISLLQMFLSFELNNQMNLKSKIEKKAIEKEKVNVELGALKDQLNPHFLFNALNTLNGLIRIDSNRAITYNEQLSNVLRYTIQERKNDLVSISEELNFIDQYIKIFKSRFGDNLQYNQSISADYMDQQIPTLSLQLLVENAIKHNEISKLKTLHIKVFVEDNYLKISNNINPKKIHVTSTGLGLGNLKRRYELLLKQTIKIQQTNDSFTVSLPLKLKTKE